MSVPVLELEIDPAEARRLMRHPALRTGRLGRPRSAAVSIRWHDTAEGLLAGQGLALAEQRGRWRLERLAPDGTTPWPPGMPAPMLAEAPSAKALGFDGVAVPLAGFEGRQRRMLLLEAEAEIALGVLEGTLRAADAERRCCRLTLSGPAGRLVPVAEQIMGELRARVPRASLAAEAITLAHREVAVRPLGAPEAPSGSSVAEAFAHIAGHLTGVILHWSAQAARGSSPEPVHQMRVAVRRLRSALSLFDPAIAGPTVQRLQGELRDLAGRLGAARDWDVFLAEIAAPVQAAFGDDRRLDRLAAAAFRRRQAAYGALGAYLDGPRFRVLGLHLAGLAALRAWVETANPEQAALLAEDVAQYGARLLARRRRKMLKVGKGIAELPPGELHALRKRGKKLRYGCEFFSPLFPPKPARRFLKRLASLQEQLGHLNDGATAATLMAELGRGRDRAFASGAVQGFVAAKGSDLRAGAQKSWTKFRAEKVFWD